MTAFVNNVWDLYYKEYVGYHEDDPNFLLDESKKDSLNDVLINNYKNVKKSIWILRLII